MLFLLPVFSKSQNTLPGTTVNGSLQVDSTMTVSDTLHAQGDLIVGGNVTFDSTLVVSDTMRAQKDLVVQGSAKIVGDLNINGRIAFGSNGDGFTFTTSNLTVPNILSFGKGVGSPLPISSCVTGFLTTNPNLSAFQLKDILQVGTSDPTGPGYLVNGSVLSMQSWGTGSSIDVSGGTGGNGSLLINYFCGKDVAICTGSLGGIVALGDKVLTNKNLQIGANWQAIDPNVSLNIFQNGTADGLKLWPVNATSKMINSSNGQFVVYGDGNIHSSKNIQIGFNNATIQDANTSVNITANNTNGIKINTSNNVLSAFTINNSNYTSYSPFSVYGDGNAHFGKAIQIGFTNSTMQNLNYAININNPSSDGIRFNTYNNLSKLIRVYNTNYGGSQFTVAGDGKTYIGGEFLTNSNYMLTVNGKIGAREIKVSMQNPWPDFVFEKSYALQNLFITEKYIRKNKHLPGIPSAKELQKEECGLNLSEMQGLQMQKIEEIYLYLIEMKKEIETLKKENQILKKQLLK